ncbi:MAG TPA: methionine biosynthesis protein MetW [Desulfohalobiaceae bacterium]|nr:methionine biosynthesis protein MetW [Desulfohalobiaceae bacterium]
MRFDLKTIASWIHNNSRVLDLGCGSGELLHYLQAEKKVKGTGIEINEDKVTQGIIHGVNIIHGDIHEEIQDYPQNAFDYVILSQTLQQILKPAVLIYEMLRVGGQGIVSFPNFSHYKNRFFLLFKGKAPISRELPYAWYDTPNIRVIPLKDFRRFCHSFDIDILKEVAISTHHHEERGRTVHFLPNILATYGIYLLKKSPDLEQRQKSQKHLEM